MVTKVMWALVFIGLGVLALLIYKQVFGGVGAGTAKVKAAKGVSFKDPCPGNDTIWDAATQKCIPLVEEPVPMMTGSKSWN